jgi:membrane protein
MDVIWRVSIPKSKSLITNIRQKIGPFVLISSLGLIIIAWARFAAILFNLISLTSIGIKLLEILLSFALSTLLFSVIYKQIPQTKVEWQDVLLSSLVTGLAFTIVNYLFGSYVQTFPVTTVVGAAGSLIVLLIWIFILNQIVLFGAELSKVYAITFGSYSKKPAS